MAKYIHKSFSKGILSTNVSTRYDLEQYDEAARELININIGRQGVVGRRGGTTIVSHLDETPYRLIPFYSAEKSFLIAFASGRLTRSNTSDKIRTNKIKIIDVTDYSIDKHDIDFSGSDFHDSSDVEIFGRGAEDVYGQYEEYSVDPNRGFSRAQLETLEYTQLGNLLVLTHSTLPPTYIRREGDNFVFYKSIFDLYMNGDDEERLQDKAAFGLPYTFYGMGMAFESFAKSRRNGSFTFTGNLILKENFDSSILKTDNLHLFRNRAFVFSTTTKQEPTEDDNQIRVFVGVIRDVDLNYRGSTSSNNRYRVRGEVFVDQSGALSDLKTEESTLFLCDWSNRLGFPKTTASFENRICYASTKAFPSKFWFSAQPSTQKIAVGNKVIKTTKTDVQAETELSTPIHKYVFYDQLSLFNNASEALGLTQNQPASSGGYFINDDLSFKIHWIKGGEVCYIGTNQGLFISQGTNASSQTTFPFNSGFIKVIDHPVKAIPPELVNKDLYFISADNSTQKMTYSSAKGYGIETLDSLSREIVRDPTETSIFTKNFREYSIGGGATDAFDRTQFIGNVPFDFSEDNLDSSKVTIAEDVGDQYVKEYMYSSFAPDKDKEIARKVLDFSEIHTFPQNVKDVETDGVSFLNGKLNDLWANKFPTEANKLTEYSTNFYISSILYSAHIESNVGNLSSGIASLYLQCMIKKDQTSHIPDLFQIKPLVIEGEENKERSVPVSGATAQTPQFKVGDQIDFDTFIKGKISTGGHIGLDHNVKNNRLIGIDLAAGTIKLFFKNSFTGRVVVRQGKNTFYDGNVTATTASANTEFHRDGTSMNIYSASVNKGVSAADAVLDTTTVTEVAFFDAANEVTNNMRVNVEDVSNVWQMRDSLATDLSGEYDIKYLSFDIYSHNTLTISPNAAGMVGLTGEIYTKSELPEMDFLVSVDGFTTLAEVDASIQDVAVTDITQVTEDEEIVSITTRLLYDWAQKGLMIYRKDRTCLTYFYDDSSSVNGWTKNNYKFISPVYVRNLEFDIPRKHPAMFGIEGNNIVMLTQALINGKQPYIEELPNCVDSHVVVDLDRSDSIDLSDLQETLENIGYEDDDEVVVASKDKIILPRTRVSELSGNVDGIEDDYVVVGKPFISNITTYIPLIQTRSGVTTLGKNHSITELTLNAIYLSDMIINDSLEKAQPIDDFYKKETYGTGYQNFSVSSPISYDAFLEILLDTPFPFAIGGYIMDIKTQEQT